MNNTFVIIDAHFVCHRAKHSLKGLSHNEKQTGVIFGFLKTLLMLSQMLKSNKFIFAWDSSSSLRRDIYPNYKKREISDDPEKIELERISRPQFVILRRHILPKIGFVNNFYCEGYEADDIVASVILDNEDSIIVSSDNDMYQLLDKSSMFDLGKKSYYTRKDLMEEYGVSPNQWKDIKCIAGCTSDKVSGIPYKRGEKEVHIGYNVAAKYVTGTMKKGNVLNAILSKEGQETIKINKPLVVLPFEGTPKFDLKEDKLSLDGFMDICYEYDLMSFINGKDFDKWKTTFRME